MEMGREIEGKGREGERKNEGKMRKEREGEI